MVEWTLLDEWKQPLAACCVGIILISLIIFWVLDFRQSRKWMWGQLTSGLNSFFLPDLLASVTSLYQKIWEQKARWVWSKKGVSRLCQEIFLQSQVFVMFISRSLFLAHMMPQLTLRQPVMTLRTSIRGWQDQSLTLRKWSARKMTSMGKTNSSTCYLIRTNLRFGKQCVLYWNQYCKACFCNQNRLQSTVPVNIPPLSNIMY